MALRLVSPQHFLPLRSLFKVLHANCLHGCLTELMLLTWRGSLLSEEEFTDWVRILRARSFRRVACCCEAMTFVGSSLSSGIVSIWLEFSTSGLRWVNSWLSTIAAAQTITVNVCVSRGLLCADGLPYFVSCFACGILFEEVSLGLVLRNSLWRYWELS